MIFPSFFKNKNKWQSKDSNVRITAINEDLAINNTEQRAILRELAKRDENELVRRAALIKLNDFDDFYHACQSNSFESVQHFAKKQYQAILFGQHTIALARDKKLDFIAEQDLSASFIDNWLHIESDEAIVIALFERLSNIKLANQKNNHQLVLQTFSQKRDAAIQEYLVKQVEESTLLNKLAKKSVNGDIRQLIDNKLAKIQAELEKPIKSRKQINLVLSKLLALKEVKHFDDYLSKKNLLVEQWHNLHKQLHYLSQEEQNQFVDKYEHIKQQLDKIFASKAESFEQEKIAQQLERDKQVARESFSQSLVDINQKLTTAVFESTCLDQKAFLTQLTQLKEEIVSSVLSHNEQDDLTKQVGHLTARLNQLPEIAESVTQATHLISKMSQLALPESMQYLNERCKIYNDWLIQWAEVEKKSAGILPESIVSAQQEIKSSWRSGLKPLQQQQKKLFFHNKKKLADIKRLLSAGKYKVCFGLFNGVKQDMPLFSESQQLQLRRDFVELTEKMAELSDWEHYIATPRKQDLLIQVQALVTEPLDNPNEQAKQVKSFRKIWNSLGHADEDIDQELNAQFNLACEQAFAPCRLFYAEQEKLRAVHLSERNNIIAQAEKLALAISVSKANIDFKELDEKLNRLQQKWTEAGEVDRTHYKTLQSQFKTILQPIKEAIKAFHNANAIEKKALIAKAELELTNEDTYQAIEKVKKLQIAWREIGFTGTHQERKLWQKFRLLNDQLFTKRDELKSQLKQAQSSLYNELNQQLDALKEQFLTLDVSSDNNIQSQLLSIKDAASKLLSNVIAQKTVSKSMRVNVEEFTKEISNKLEQLHKVEQQNNWKYLFELLQKIISEPLTFDQVTQEPLFVNLSSYWQKRVQQQMTLTDPASQSSRFDKTLEIEILAKAESPKELVQQRMAIQVKLMQSQMVSGEAIDLKTSFIDWLNLGKLTTEEQGLLNRLETIYCQ